MEQPLVVRPPKLSFTRPVNLVRLATEIMAVPGTQTQITHPLTGTSMRSLVRIAMTESADGVSVDWDDDSPISQAAIGAIKAVVAAHDASPDLPPVVFSDEIPVDSGVVRTVGVAPSVILRRTLPPATGFVVELVVIGVDAASFAARVQHARFSVKRQNAGALVVGAPAIDPPQADPATTSWSISGAAQGNDVIISVSGAANRTVDWTARGSVVRFAPGGLPANGTP
jgi:hypothetical protein